MTPNDNNIPPAGHADAEQSGGQTVERLVIPEIEEHAVVGKREVVTGQVRLRKTVDEHDEQIVEHLRRRNVDVERVAVDQPVADAANPPQPRREGEVLVIPVLEERLVVERKLFVVEEVRVREVEATEQVTETVTLRRENVDVVRTDAEPNPAGT